MKRISLMTVVSAIIMAIVSSGCKDRYVEKMSYTFVVAGDDRVAPEDTAGNPSTINIYHFKRLLAEVAQLSPLPKYLFFNGDLVLGYTGHDTVKLANELRAWIKLYKESPLASSGVELVAIPGNHEIVEKEGSGKIAFVTNERIFVREMHDYIRGDNGPKATGFVPGTDSLWTDQSRLSYSFDFGGDHFVILSTDAVARESRISWHWLKNDLKDAHENGARHIFLFGHKPPFPSHYESESGMEEFKASRDSMWAVIEKYNCDAYFGSHFHLWDSVQMHKGKTWEIVCGNSGAPMGKDWPQSYYGYTIVGVSDKVDITSMGHDVDKEHYTAPTPDKPTTVRAKFTIQ
jgi:hypothetical protein